MKKVLSLILVIAMLFAFCAMIGCGDKEDEKTNDEQTNNDANKDNNEEKDPPADGEITEEMLKNSKPNEYVVEKIEAGMEVSVAQCYGTLNDPFFQGLCDDITAYLEGKGLKVVVNAGTEEDLTDHLQRAENLLEMDLAMVILNTSTPDAWADFNDMCEEKGCYFFIFGSKPNFFDEMYGAILNINNTIFGQAMARAALAWVDEKYPDAGDGEIKTAVFLMNTGTNAERMQACYDALKADPRINIVYTTDYALTLDQGYTAMEEALIYDDEVRLMACFTGDVAVGANNLLDAMDMDKSEFGLFTSGTSPTLLEEIEKAKTDDSAIRGTVVQGALMPAAEAIASAAYGLLDGTTALRSETMETLGATTSFGFDEITAA